MSNNRTFTRNNDDRWVAGVCSGVAQYIDVAPIWVRVAMILLALASGLGILIYIVLLFLMKPGDGGNSPLQDLMDSPKKPSEESPKADDK